MGARTQEGPKAMGADRQDARWYTVREVAVRYQVAERTVRRWIAEDRLSAHKFGRAVRFSEQDLIAFEKEARR